MSAQASPGDCMNSKTRAEIEDSNTNTGIAYVSSAVIASRKASVMCSSGENEINSVEPRKQSKHVEILSITPTDTMYLRHAISNIEHTASQNMYNQALRNANIFDKQLKQGHYIPLQWCIHDS